MKYLLSQEITEKENCRKSLQEKEDLLTDLKSRQLQLQNINRVSLLVFSKKESLKDEVRRLSRGERRFSSQPSSGSVSPSLTRNSSGYLPGNPNFSNTFFKTTDKFSGTEKEYIKVVFLKFLECRERRKELLPVLGMLLQLNPQELLESSRNITG